MVYFRYENGGLQMESVGALVGGFFSAARYAADIFGHFAVDKVGF